MLCYVMLCYQERALSISADKHRLNKTSNKVHERLLTDAKKTILWKLNFFKKEFTQSLRLIALVLC